VFMPPAPCGRCAVEIVDGTLCFQSAGVIQHRAHMLHLLPCGRHRFGFDFFRTSCVIEVLAHMETPTPCGRKVFVDLTSSGMSAIVWCRTQVRQVRGGGCQVRVSRFCPSVAHMCVR
jgi:hypothetical protein